MKLHRFCSKCGKSLNNDIELSDNFLCQECLGCIELEILIPQIILHRCKLCGAYSISKDSNQSEWFYQKKDEFDLDFLTRILYEKVIFAMEKKMKIKIEIFFPNDLKLSMLNEIPLVFQAKSESTNQFLQKSLKINLKLQVCANCAKKIGNRFDAILQIRIQSERDQDRLDEIMNLCEEISYQSQMKDARNFVAKVEKVPNGFDLKLSSNNFLRILFNQLKKRFCFQIKRSAHLVGVDPENGADLYRQTLLLKLVPVKKDDIIIIENIEYTVHKITNQKLYLQNNVSKQITQANFSIFEKKRFQILSR